MVDAYLTTMPQAPARRWITVASAALLSTLGAAGAHAQMTLGDALRRADRAAYGNRIAEGTAADRSAQALLPLRGILPAVRLETGFIRTTDPIGVFGSTLRQRAVTPANFDPTRLNRPDALGNYQAGIVIEQPIFNADAWAGRRAATRAADATRAQADWTRLSTRVDVVRAYYGAILAAERATTLQAAARAAHAHVTQAEAMVRQGLVTRSDALLAAVRAGEVDAQLAEAQGAAESARHQLAVLLGGSADPQAAAVALPARLPHADRIRNAVAPDTADAEPGSRGDVRAATEGLAAARADANRARAAYLPRINSFARYDWNSAARPWEGDRNWTVGVMASWTLFAGASELADIQATNGRADAARAQAEAAQANARLGAAQSRTALVVALARLAIAERAVAQSAEAHRIVGRKYAGGLATVAELLDAQAMETSSALSFSQVRWGTIVAAAERKLALGLDPAALNVLDEPTVAARDAGEPR